MEKPSILCYGIDEREVSRLEKAAKCVGASVRKPLPAEYSLPIAAAAANLPVRRPYEGPLLPEGMLVFVSFPEGTLDLLLSELKKNGIGIGILKAILTPYNAVMTPFALYEELCRERKAFLQRK